MSMRINIAGDVLRTYLFIGSLGSLTSKLGVHFPVAAYDNPSVQTREDQITEAHAPVEAYEIISPVLGE